jgi:hypothetical protein
MKLRSIVLWVIFTRRCQCHRPDDGDTEDAMEFTLSSLIYSGMLFELGLYCFTSTENFYEWPTHAWPLYKFQLYLFKIFCLHF